MTLTFSCDIAYSDSPTASRASAWSQKYSTCERPCPRGTCRPAVNVQSSIRCPGLRRRQSLLHDDSAHRRRCSRRSVRSAIGVPGLAQSLQLRAGPPPGREGRLPPGHASRPRTIIASGSYSSRERVRRRPRSTPRRAARTTSTFSCDIAYSDSPTASRASAPCVEAGPTRRPSRCRQRAHLPELLRHRGVATRAAATNRPRLRASCFPRGRAPHKARR